MGFKGKSISVANYDAGNRLTVWNRAGADENHSQTWDYDDAGNWNSTTKDGDTESRNHSVSDQITQLGGNPVSHDLKGNLTEYKYGRKNYKVKYDLDNRIVSMKSNRRKVTYRYDALGRRIISKKNGNKTALIWWGDSECAEYKHGGRQRVVQHDIMGHPTRLNSVIARDTAKRKRKVKLQWYHKNYLDHVYAVSDDNGNIDEHYRYTAFGEPEIYSPTGQKLATSAIDNTVLWNSRRYDFDTNLYYYKYRHYKSDIGRWLGRDPICEFGGNNLYAFAGNDPIGRWDRYGQWWSGFDAVVNYIKSVPDATRELYGDTVGEIILTVSIVPYEEVATGDVTAIAAGVLMSKVPGSKAIVKSAKKVGKPFKKADGKCYQKVDAKVKAKKKKKGTQPGCKPCKPGVGSGVYEIALPGSRERGRHARDNGGHVKVWYVNQIPYKKGNPMSCKCKWGKPVTFDDTQTPPPNTKLIGTTPGNPKLGIDPAGGGVK